MHTMALGLAVNARGADHNRSGAYQADLSGDLDRLDGGQAHVAAAIETEDRAAVMDSMILCKFLRGVFTEPFDEWAALLRPVTGWDVDARAARHRAAHRRPSAGVQHPRGLDCGQTTGCPSGSLSEHLQVESGREASWTPQRLRQMIRRYYAARGLEARVGRCPPPARTPGAGQ
jgi:aldehyde:ferredoxin oxidoreductase